MIMGTLNTREVPAIETFHDSGIESTSSREVMRCFFSSTKMTISVK